MNTDAAVPAGISASTARLSSIDLLRGGAALTVAVFHAFHNGILPSVHPTYDARFFLLLPISYGYAGVYLFFVISGFCIHLRWARATSTGQEPKNDFGAFWKRRLRRLYPAYAVALAIGIAFAIHDGGASAKGFGLDIGAHVLLVHNFSSRTLMTINPVFWTLAVEEQLYLLYFLLLWLRRRFRWRTILVISIGVRVAWQLCAWVAAKDGLSLVVSGSAQTTWFIWVLGALSVEAFYGLVRLPSWTRSLPLAGSIFLATIALAFIDWQHHFVGVTHIASELLEQPGWGIAAFITVNAVISRESWLHIRRKHFAVAPWLWLGLVSYSLYLFHMYVYRGFGIWHVFGVALAIIAAGLGFVLFERPFLKAKERRS